MRIPGKVLRFIIGIALLTMLFGCGGGDDSSTSPPASGDTTALVSIIPNSNTLTMPPTQIVATFNTKVLSFGANFIRITGTCATLPNTNTVIDASGTVVTVTLTNSNCLGNQSLTITLDPSQAVFASAVTQPGSVWTRTYTIPLGKQSVGGKVSGLVGTLVLVDNGGDALTLKGDGAFVFPTLVGQNSKYAVTVQTQPTTQTCTVENGGGTMGTAAIQNVSVVCSTHEYTVGGTVSGLDTALMRSVILQIGTSGTNTVQTQLNSAFAFPQPIAEGSPYTVYVRTQPVNESCTVTNGSGVMGAGPVTNVVVTCGYLPRAVGGTVSGLTDAGLHGTVVLQDNASDDLSIDSDGPFNFATQLITGSTYNVTVLTQPIDGICSVTNGSGVVGVSAVTSVAVSCVNTRTSLSVAPTGVIPVGTGTGTVLVTNTGIDTATNIKAVLPSAWTAVTEDASSCTSLAAGQSCTLSFTASAPYVAQSGIGVTADNVSVPPTTALAFSIQGFQVFSVDSGSTATVVDSKDFGPDPWMPLQGAAASPDAKSRTDGAANTAIIVAAYGSTSSPYAASDCYNSTTGGASVGTWYLPAICQIAPSSPGECASGIPNLYDNLLKLGFGWVNNTNRWSSTGNSFGANFLLPPMLADSVTPSVANRLRCVRSINY